MGRGLKSVTKALSAIKPTCHKSVTAKANLVLRLSSLGQKLWSVDTVL